MRAEYGSGLKGARRRISWRVRACQFKLVLVIYGENEEKLNIWYINIPLVAVFGQILPEVSLRATRYVQRHLAQALLHPRNKYIVLLRFGI